MACLYKSAHGLELTLMWYAIICDDVPGSLPLRLPLRDQHLARLTALAGQGRLLAAGPHPSADTEDFASCGVSGSLIIAQFESLQEAQTWADADPYVEHGIHSRVIVKPFLKVLP